MADSKFTKGRERTFSKLKEALEELDKIVYVTTPKKKSKEELEERKESGEPIKTEPKS